MVFLKIPNVPEGTVFAEQVAYISLGALVLIVGIDMKNNGHWILRTAKHTLKFALFENSRLKNTSNTINSIALL